MRFRPYAPADRDACLALFDGNVPRYFDPDERAGFAAFLDALPGPFLVADDGGRVVACGGWAVEADTGDVALCWGIVDAARHREGIGDRLTRARLRDALAGAPRAVVIRTSQHTQGFYERLGFAVARVVPDGHAPGIDFVEMRRPPAPPPPDAP